jgi:hypothetical protein
LTVTSNDGGAGLSMTYVFMYDLLSTLCRVFFEKSMVSQPLTNANTSQEIPP